MNKKFLEELAKEEQLEKISIKDLNQTCSDIKEQNEEIKAHFARFKKFEVKVDSTHVNLFKSLLNSLKTIKIPEEIHLSRSEKIIIENSTRKWLLYYFACSFLVVILSLGFAFYSYQYEYKPKHELQLTDQQNEWMIKYLGYMGEKNPQDHLKFVNKYPFPK
jgi:phage regulator Rha-like protein